MLDTIVNQLEQYAHLNEQSRAMRFILVLGCECAVSRFGFFFFFSSRRRHTRLVSDWSSDVCSSDLCERSIRAETNSCGVPFAQFDGTGVTRQQPNLWRYERQSNDGSSLACGDCQ